jgi:predicted nucleotidyltransferase component of viral defense system
MKQKYEEQVKLLVRVLPYVAKEECFALKGGTSINLFVRDLPRLSVDIDLTYLGFENRDVATKNINEALLRITEALNKVGIKSNSLNNNKIICSTQNATIKIEPNYTIRGYAFEPQKMRTNPKVEEKFGFANINVISFAELYGGKICAALDRQHPRDLFDVRYLLDSEGISEEIKDGFIVALLSHNRPPHELLQPNIHNQEGTFAKEFIGMSNEPFTYQNHLETLNELIIRLSNALNQNDKGFMLSFFSADPDWDKINIPNISKLPAIQWKLQNLEKLKSSNYEKFSEQSQKLHNIFK